MVINPGKSHYTCLGKNVDDNKVLNFNDIRIKSSKEVEILGLKIDSKINFHSYVKTICSLSSLLRVSPNLNIRRKNYYIN